MLKSVTHAGLAVHDQDAAIAFYTDKLGFELRNDVTIADGALRCVTVAPPGTDLEVILLPPGGPGTAEDARSQALELIAQGLIPGLIFRVDDCRATYEELKGRGVEMTQEPIEQSYGIDAAFRDPSGNHIRFTQPLG